MAVRAEGVGGGARSECSSSAITKGFLKGTDVLKVKRKEEEKQSSKSTMKQESQTPLPLQAISYEEMSQNVRLGMKARKTRVRPTNKTLIFWTLSHEFHQGPFCLQFPHPTAYHLDLLGDTCLSAPI